MNQRVLITGGAGFIGSHLADELLEQGYQVRVLDCLLPQVHGPGAQRPGYLSPDVELIVGDVRDAAAVERALQEVDAVFHLAAAVGVGQSMYEVEHYTSVNNLGTAVLLQALAGSPVERLVVASSMSIYGEGAYRSSDGEPVVVGERPLEQLRRGDWEPLDEQGRAVFPVATPETKTPAASSVYALSKYDQERLCLIVGGAYKIPTVALRFFNAYGPRQALSNPYTGVLAIFSAQYLSGRRPSIFEDGLQQRDFVNVHDVARACRLAMEVPEAAGQVFNVGSGQAVTVREVAAKIGETLGISGQPPEITERYRVGDIRHCFADISKATEVLGYRPQVSFGEGLTELARWLESQPQVVNDSSTQAREELTARGLVV